MTPRVIPKSCDSPPNPVLYIPDDPDSDPSLSDSSLSESADSSDGDYYKQRQHVKKDNKMLE